MNILNVDDYDPARHARSSILRSAGYDVTEAATGADALRLATVASPTLVLLDVHLPDMSGFEVCRRLKADPATAPLPVLQISATLVGASDAAIGLEGGADAYLTEPVEPPVLVATINALLRARRAEAEWQSTFDAMADGLAFLDGAGVILRGNAALDVGQEPGGLVGRSLEALWDLPAPALPGFPFGRMRASHRRESAELARGNRWFRLTVDPMVEAGQVVGAVAIVTDVTDWKRLVAERESLLRRAEEARAQAEAANRAKDDFLAMVSHDLRDPLNAVVGWVRVLRAGTPDAAALQRALDAIERSVQLQRRLVDDLLDTASIMSGQPTLALRPLRLLAPVSAALDAVRPGAEAKGVTLEATLDPDAGWVVGDPGRLQQVVSNLLVNAVKFTPAGGRVELRLEPAGERVRIRVSDSGGGISPEFLPHVFERFRRADRRARQPHEGLGLGLTIVRHLVEAHGGTVRAESPGEGKGATFIVELPAGPL